MIARLIPDFAFAQSGLLLTTIRKCPHFHNLSGKGANHGSVATIFRACASNKEQKNLREIKAIAPLCKSLEFAPRAEVKNPISLV
jgi:hypothetical protein